MKFIINLLPNDQLDEQNLISFVNNITNQYHRSELAIVIKNDGQLNTGLFEFINNLPVIVYDDPADIELATQGETYWLNLHVDDALLPDAIMQWENTLDQHPINLLFLSTVDNESSIGEQLDPFLESTSDVKINTIRHIFDVDVNTELVSLPLRKKLNLLLGLQSYYINDRNYRYRTFFNNVDLSGRNVLYRIDSDKLASKKPLLAKLLYDLIEDDEYLKLNMPTLVLSANSVNTELNAVLQMIDNLALIFDEKIKNYYSKALVNRLSALYSSIVLNHANLGDSKTLMAKLKSAVNELPYDLKKQIKLKVSHNGLLGSIQKLF